MKPENIVESNLGCDCCPGDMCSATEVRHPFQIMDNGNTDEGSLSYTLGASESTVWVVRKDLDGLNRHEICGIYSTEEAAEEAAEMFEEFSRYDSDYPMYRTFVEEWVVDVDEEPNWITNGTD